MLPLKLVEEVQRLLQTGEHSQRTIASLLNVSRGTVNAIATGKRGIHGLAADDEGELSLHDPPPERCPGCGGMVYVPCLLCEARKYQQRRQLAASRKRSSALHKRVA